MKKNYLLIIILFLLSGCSVEYNLDFNDNELIEKIKIGKFDSSKVEDFQYLEPYAIINDTNQEFYKFDYSNQYLNLKYTYKTSEFESSEPFSECYELSNISYDNDYYYILTSNEFKCLTYANYTSDEVKIKFTTNHKVIDTNADYTDNNTSIWVINRNNYKNKPIKIKVDKTIEEVVEQKDDNNKIGIILWIVIGIIIIFMILIALHIKRKVNMNKL